MPSQLLHPGCPLERAFVSMTLDTGDRCAESARAVLDAAAPEEVARALDVLWSHNLFPMLAHRLSETGLLSAIPEDQRENMLHELARVRQKNTRLILTAASILKRARDHGQPLLALKGLVLNAAYYPAFYLRPMGDIDFVSVPGRDAELFELVESLGFHKSPHHVDQDDGITYVNGAGTICDAHSRLRLFEPSSWEALSREVELPMLRGVRVHILEPAAMLAHWAVHAKGHIPETGPVLIWLLDLALILRKHPEVSPEKVRKLCQGDDEASGHASWGFLMQCVKLLESLGYPVPKAFVHAARYTPYLSLEAVLRQRRLKRWGLPSVPGLLRLAAHRVGYRPRPYWPVPTMGDLALWPVDSLLLRVTPAVSALTSQRGTAGDPKA